MVTSEPMNHQPRHERPTQRSDLLDILQGLRSQAAAGHLAPWDEEWLQHRIAVVTRELDLLRSPARRVTQRHPSSRNLRPLRSRPSGVTRT